MIFFWGVGPTVDGVFFHPACFNYRSGEGDLSTEGFKTSFHQQIFSNVGFSAHPC